MMHPDQMMHPADRRRVRQLRDDARAIRREQAVEQLRQGVRQRATRIPSGKAYRRTVGKRVEA